MEAPRNDQDHPVVVGAALACVAAAVTEGILVVTGQVPTPWFTPDVGGEIDHLEVLAFVVTPVVLVLCADAMTRYWLAAVIAFAVSSCAFSYWLVLSVTYLDAAPTLAGVHSIAALALTVLLAAAVRTSAGSQRTLTTVASVVSITFGLVGLVLWIPALLGSGAGTELLSIGAVAPWPVLLVCGAGMLLCAERPFAVVGAVATAGCAVVQVVTEWLLAVAVLQLAPLTALLVTTYVRSRVEPLPPASPAA